MHRTPNTNEGLRSRTSNAITMLCLYELYLCNSSYTIWLTVDKEGTIPSSHCLGCKAGLAESCAHVAGVLFCESEMKCTHANFQLTRCGLFINEQYPFLHATPDFLTSCDCCGFGCGEVKFPICIGEYCDFYKYVTEKSS